MPRSKTTPMIQQYLSIKDRYKDAILFYRMGDFYEMFFEDAEKASQILGITLTSRNKNDETPIPMCGIPHHAAKNYIARLIEQGLKIAVCDQVEDPSTAKGLVKREVVRVITPGMIVEDDLLESGTNNFILAFNIDGNGAGLACLDISTGDFRVCESDNFETLVDEARRIAPKEVLLPESARQDDRFVSVKRVFAEQSVSFRENGQFGYSRGRERLTSLFQTVSLEGFGCEALKTGVGAAGAIIQYVSDTQKQAVAHIQRLTPYVLSDYLQVDDISCRNLELMENIRTGSRKGTLISVLDKTVTAMGARLIKQWLRYPLMDVGRIDQRLNAVAEAVDNPSATADIRSMLKTVADLERLGSKLSMAQGNARDLLALKRSFQAFPALQSRLEAFSADLYRFDTPVDALAALAREIDLAIREDAPLTIHDGGLIREGFDSALDELILISRDGKGWLARLENQEREATGISNLKVKYNKVFGYFIEVSKARIQSVPDHYVRKQTLVNAERYITDELKQFEAKVLGAEEKRARLEYNLFCLLRQKIIENTELIFSVARFIARLDCLLCLAATAEQNDYRRPTFNRDGIIDIADGRHPVVERVLKGERFVPNSIRLDNDSQQVLIITGPNMAGKSTILRQTAIIVIMAQMGGFVPADTAVINITDRIFTRVGALDNLSSGQSTFLVEMQETANILNSATPRSLVILDEIGRGTSTFDGLSIAWAVASYLHDLDTRGVKTLFATHYHELCELADLKPRVRNYHIAVKEWNDEILFLRKLVAGGTNRSYGIQVARLAGIPRAVISQAKEKLFNIERQTQNDIKQAALPTDGGHTGRRVQQLSLFQTARQEIINELRRIDINRISPLEALSRLDRLKQIAEENING
ncbi:MAG: DNA mismatch repair protein MutS [Deltaproteobacteria bacterium]|nr:MAG: DNA mismatch repair protein MutS [Deltaproteobacteria bacterium]